MGIKLFSSSSFDSTPGSGEYRTKRHPIQPEKTIEPTDPDPSRYSIVRVNTDDNYTLLKIHYWDCTNYEGQKILLYDVPYHQLATQELLDPHFLENEKYYHPIARFVPTERGWKMGLDLIHVLRSGKQ